MVDLSFSAEDLGCQATRYFPGWYLVYFTRPAIGFQFIWTLNGDIKMETWILLSLKNSFSKVSSITTTSPSAGQRISSGFEFEILTGNLKNCKKKVKIMAEMGKEISNPEVEFVLKKYIKQFRTSRIVSINFNVG
jgi:hypothetical protein